MPTFPEEKGKMSNQTIRHFLVWWNSAFFIDFLYRKKFNIRFNSKEHRELSFIDMKIELEEDLMFKEFQENLEKRKENEEMYKITKNWLNLSNKGVSDEEFATIDLSKMKKQYQELERKKEKKNA